MENTASEAFKNPTENFAGKKALEVGNLIQEKAKAIITYSHFYGSLININVITLIIFNYFYPKGYRSSKI